MKSEKINRSKTQNKEYLEEAKRQNIELLKEASELLNNPVPNMNMEYVMKNVDELLDEYNNIKKQMERQNNS